MDAPPPLPAKFWKHISPVLQKMHLTKLVVDAHVQYCLGNVDTFQLADVF